MKLLLWSVELFWKVFLIRFLSVVAVKQCVNMVNIHHWEQSKLDAAVCKWCGWRWLNDWLIEWKDWIAFCWWDSLLAGGLRFNPWSFFGKSRHSAAILTTSKCSLLRTKSTMSIICHVCNLPCLKSAMSVICKVKIPTHITSHILTNTEVLW